MCLSSTLVTFHFYLVTVLRTPVFLLAIRSSPTSTPNNSSVPLKLSFLDLEWNFFDSPWPGWLLTISLLCPHPPPPTHWILSVVSIRSAKALIVRRKLRYDCPKIEWNSIFQCLNRPHKKYPLVSQMQPSLHLLSPLISYLVNWGERATFVITSANF